LQSLSSGATLICLPISISNLWLLVRKRAKSTLNLFGMGKDKYNSSLLESLKLQYSFNLDNFCKSDDGIVIEVNSYKESRKKFHDKMLLLFAYQRKMLTLMTAGRETKRADG
jgi:hypothetical protein